MSAAIRTFALVGLWLFGLVPAPAAALAAASVPAPTSLATPPLQTPDAGDRVRGMVAGVADGQVTMDDGTTFQLTDATSVIVSVPGTPSDLHPGQFVAVTARPDLDGTLLASMVRASSESSSSSFVGQFPMDDGNLMTNASIDDATIDALSGGELTVSFNGETAQVRLVPETSIILRVPGAPADIQAGDTISATVTGGIAQSVSVQ